MRIACSHRLMGSCQSPGIIMYKCWFIISKHMYAAKNVFFCSYVRRPKSMMGTRPWRRLTKTESIHFLIAIKLQNCSEKRFGPNSISYNDHKKWSFCSPKWLTKISYAATIYRLWCCLGSASAPFPLRCICLSKIVFRWPISFWYLGCSFLDQCVMTRASPE